MATNVNRIKELRNQKDMTQAELGQIVNVQKSAISKYEKGRAEPSMDILRKLANYFNVSTDYLLGRTDIPEPLPSYMPKDMTPDELARFKEKVASLSKDGKFSWDRITLTPQESPQDTPQEAPKESPRDNGIHITITPEDKAVLDAIHKAPSNITNAITSMLAPYMSTEEDEKRRSNTSTPG